MEADVPSTLNGQPVRVRTDGDRWLLWILRTGLGLTVVLWSVVKTFAGR
jgi:aerobic-type carbon monoxide dehydrogenase small subunit (CoxS/CutS family)